VHSKATMSAEYKEFMPEVYYGRETVIPSGKGNNGGKRYRRPYGCSRRRHSPTLCTECERVGELPV